MKTGIERIEEERERQISQEGYTPEHDDNHDDSELLKAADCYITAVRRMSQLVYKNLWKKLPALWPWDKEWWKPSDDPVRNLVKAGALIAAEIDRIQRLQSEKTDEVHQEPGVDSLHCWWELSYANYLTIPRTVMQSMPDHWQGQMARLLNELDDTIDWRPKAGCYWVHLKDDNGRFVKDPLADYERGRRRIPHNDVVSN